MPPWEKYVQDRPTGRLNVGDGPWSKYAAPTDGGSGVVRQFGAGANATIANIMDAPGTLMRPVVAPAARAVSDIILSVVGMEPNTTPADPGMGTDPAAMGAQRMPDPVPPGIGVTDYLRDSPEPVTPAERVARRAGEVTVETLPFAALPMAGAVARGAGPVASIPKSTTQRVLQSLTDTAARAPGRTAMMEGTGAFGAGVGSGVAQEVDPGNPTTEALAMLAGGIAPSVPGMAAKGAWSAANKLPLTGALLRWGRRMMPFTESGGLERAGARVRSLAGDTQEATRRLDEDSIGNLTPAQRTGDKRLMALERAVLDADAKLDDEFAKQTREATRQLRESIEEMGTDVPVSETRDFIEGRREYVLSLLDQRARQAAEMAEQRIARLYPAQRQSEASAIVREEIESALGQAKAQERALWDQVPRDTEVATDNSRRVYRAFTGRLTPEEIEASPELADLVLPRAQLDKIPAKARQFLDPESNQRLRDADTVAEVQGLRSDLLETARNARAAGEMNTARVANRLADALLDDLGARVGAAEGEAGESLRMALDFSRGVAERFRQGAVGRVLGSERAGGQSVAPEMTLESTVGAGGTRGSVAAGQIREAAPTDQANESIRQYLLNRFNRSAGKDGRINPEQARKFVDDNADLLDAFPQMRRDMLEAGTAQEFASRTAQRAQQTRQRLSQRNKSRTAEFLGADVDEEIDKVFKANNPHAFARELRRLTAKDDSGRAFKGLKTAVVDYLIRKGSSGFDDAGEPLLSGKALQGVLRDRKFRAAAQQLLTDAEMSRLGRVANELQRVEMSQGRLPEVGGIVNDAPSNTLQFITSILAAQQGRRVASKMGGGTVQTPGLFVGRAKNFLRNLTRDKAEEILIEAVRDRELFRALLTDTATPAGRKDASQRINAWLAETGAVYASDDD